MERKRKILVTLQEEAIANPELRADTVKEILEKTRGVEPNARLLNKYGILSVNVGDDVSLDEVRALKNVEDVEDEGKQFAI